MGCLVRCIVLDVCCHMCCARSTSVGCCIVCEHVACCVLHVFCRRSYATCLRGQWDGPCCTGMLRILCSTLHAWALRVTCCTLHAVGCMRWLHVAFCTLHVVRCILSDASCTMHLVRCMLHIGCCTLHAMVACWAVSAARCIVRVGCCCLHRASGRRARVQESGGVLHMFSGSAKFESVAISDPSTATGVCVACGGRSGRRRSGAAVCRAVAWRAWMVGQSSSRAAASHALRRCAILCADSCGCCME
jgi:hypothetical protein